MSGAIERPLPSRGSFLVFRGKAAVLQLLRAATDVRDRVERLPQKASLEDLALIAEHRSPLYSESDPEERSLELGKVQNIRLALKRLDGIRIPAGRTFSFWKQVRRATKRRGYVVGRQLHEGCIVPAIGGGLCQLSNGLYDLALKAGCEVVERHPHSQIVPGSAAAVDRDATVAWNYIDLRFRPAQDIVLRARLTSDELVLGLYGAAPVKTKGIQISGFKRSEIEVVAHSCTSCGETECFRHPGGQVHVGADVRTAFVLDEVWPEFQEYISGTAQKSDIVAQPLDGRRWKRPKYAWNIEAPDTAIYATREALVRAFRARRLASYGAERLRAQFDADAALARHFGDRIPLDIGHVVIAQSMLPYLWLGGYLGGRTFDVLMTRLPLDVLHNRLDRAAKDHAGRITLSEFRAPVEVVRAEREAIDAAIRLISPHTEVQALFGDRALALTWKMPSSKHVGLGSRVLFPGPTAARKGAYELREAARQHGFTIALLASELEGGDFWDGVRTERVDRVSCLEDVALVAQPALVEDRPRTLIGAIAAGIPVVATEACGVTGMPGVLIVPFGKAEELGELISRLLVRH